MKLEDLGGWWLRLGGWRFGLNVCGRAARVGPGLWQADISGGLGLGEELMMRIFEAVRLEEQDGIVKLG